jgi:hypothetical protein
MSNERRESDEDWEACPPGALRLVVEAERRRSFYHVLQRRLIKAGSIAVVVTLLLSGVWYWNDVRPASQMSPEANHLSCVEVLEGVDRYLNDELEPEVASRVRTHLRHCRHCQEHYRVRAEHLGTELLVDVWRGVFEEANTRWLLVSIH